MDFQAGNVGDGDDPAWQAFSWIADIVLVGVVAIFITEMTFTLARKVKIPSRSTITRTKSKATEVDSISVPMVVEAVKNATDAASTGHAEEATTTEHTQEVATTSAHAEDTATSFSSNHVPVTPAPLFAWQPHHTGIASSVPTVETYTRTGSSPRPPIFYTKDTPVKQDQVFSWLACCVFVIVLLRSIFVERRIENRIQRNIRAHGETIKREMRLENEADRKDLLNDLARAKRDFDRSQAWNAQSQEQQETQRQGANIVTPDPPGFIVSPTSVASAAGTATNTPTTQAAPSPANATRRSNTAPITTTEAPRIPAPAPSAIRSVPGPDTATSTAQSVSGATSNADGATSTPPAVAASVPAPESTSAGPNSSTTTATTATTANVNDGTAQSK